MGSALEVHSIRRKLFAGLVHNTRILGANPSTLRTPAMSLMLAAEHGRDPRLTVEQVEQVEQESRTKDRP